ncbi:MAG: penicillin acylase family protein [bacterium]|nr:penicillin acylase family protein [bacterium]
MRIGLTIVGTLTLIALAATALRYVLRPPVPPATEKQLAHAEGVQIIRDEWGVPHIKGRSNADAAFGLAFAHAEDDYPLIEASLIAARGELARTQLSEGALANDFYVRLFRVREEVAARYESLSPDVRQVLEAYADGINYYATIHPDEVDSRFLPVSGSDVAAGFVHKLPLFQAVHRPLKAIHTDEELKTGDRIQKPFLDSPEAPGVAHTNQRETSAAQRSDGQSARTAHRSENDAGNAVIPAGTAPFPDFRMVASNAHAVGKRRSADGVIRLNVNSHQPWEGPVAWYEAHIQSEEGWNMIGGTFPGAPMIFHGHNEKLGWAHTVNAPDMWDVFELEMHPEAQSAQENKYRYRFGDEWLELDVREDSIAVDLGPFVWNESREFYTSVYGPTLKTDAGKFFSIRSVGRADLIRSVEQWYRMNLANSFAEWQAAMRIHAIPMFHTVYADAANIHYVYNAKIPLRSDAYDWNTIVPGNTPETLWQEYLPYDRLPSVTNPPADYIQNCNSDPFFTTDGAGNPRRENFSETAGIETRMTNRARRSHEMFGEDSAITRDEFLRYKWDRRYTRDGSIFTEAILPVLAAFGLPTDQETEAAAEALSAANQFEANYLEANQLETNRFEREALRMLRDWDGSTDETNTTAALAILSFRPIFQAIVLDRALEVPDPVESFRAAVRLLVENYGRVAVPLGEVQRLQRGDVDLAIGGGPDILNATHSKLTDDGRLIGFAGDSYILFVEFYPDGPRGSALHQYGNVNRPESPHYADQAGMFTRRTLRRSLFSDADLRERTARVYRPGQSD